MSLMSNQNIILIGSAVHLCQLKPFKQSRCGCNRFNWTTDKIQVSQGKTDKTLNVQKTVSSNAIFMNRMSRVQPQVKQYFALTSFHCYSRRECQ